MSGAKSKNFSVIKATKQNVLTIFPLKNSSEKLLLVASDLFSSPLASSFFSVKISPSVVFTAFKSPKIFNNRPVNKLVFLALTTPITTSITTALQMAMKAKNFKKQQQTLTTALITSNSFVVLDEIFSKISTAAASPLLDMDGNSSGIFSKMGQDQLLAVLPDVVLSGRLSPIPTDQMEMESTVSPSVSGAADGSAWENSAGLWQYAVVNFEDIFSATAALFNWFVLVRKDSIRILPIANQKKIISSRDTFRAKLVNLLFGCTVFEINCKELSPLSLKLPFNTFGGPKNFKPLFVGSKFYAKTAVFVVPPSAVAADMDLDLGGSPKTAILMLSAVFFALNSAVESRLASLKSHFSNLFVLIKSLVEPVGALVALVTKLLSTLSAINMSVKKYIDGLAKQNKGLAAVATIMQKKITHFKKLCEQVCLENGSDINDMVDNIDDNDNDNKDFSVYDNIFDVMMHL
ncbi:hypothetical protein G9A89_015997 [Geosiphon pyriformis]|nr:hypothetical protein G9A89_015997 [Geosiphon pyriformis]